MGELNPQIHRVTIGITETEEISIYPFSIKDQADADTAVRDALADYFKSNPDNENTELKLAGFIVDAIKKNIGRVIAIATGEDDEAIRSGSVENPLLSKITNIQAAEIIEIICRENYMVAGKKFKALITEMKQTFLSKTP